MNRTRNLLLLTVLILAIAGLALFAWQNWSPAMSLTFLGLRSLTLPLSVWILAALLAGVITYLLIYSIFGLSNYLFQQNLPPRRPRPSPPHSAQDETSSDRDRLSNARKTTDSTGSFNLNKKPESTGENENYDDWEQAPPRVNPSWDNSLDEQDFEDAEESANQSSTPQNYEVKQQPKTESWSGSVYSYGYRDPSGSGVGQTESVYDADYRVIIPPPASDKPAPTENEQDEELRDSENKQDNQSEPK